MDLYNILEMRFLQAARYVMWRCTGDERSDLYRKQRVAIEEVARQVEEMEQQAISERRQWTSRLPRRRSHQSHTLE